MNLVNTTIGSVGTQSIRSKVIWSKKNDYGLGIFISANHVYCIGSWETLNEDFIDIASINNGIFSHSKMPPTNALI